MTRVMASRSPCPAATASPLGNYVLRPVVGDGSVQRRWLASGRMSIWNFLTAITNVQSASSMRIKLQWCANDAMPGPRQLPALLEVECEAAPEAMPLHAWTEELCSICDWMERSHDSSCVSSSERPSERNSRQTCSSAPGLQLSLAGRPASGAPHDVRWQCNALRAHDFGHLPAGGSLALLRLARLRLEGEMHRWSGRGMDPHSPQQHAVVSSTVSCGACATACRVWRSRGDESAACARPPTW